ncbi:PaeR7I family type II restriction endonuclease [Radicibacter daui]|uniref:PaeR7I family type II restriction endonuclease n=1 Tax=Radicibacter daui TaxID=3064829 RepID=UPI004046ED29
MLDLADYEQQAREAVKAFWGNREVARAKQVESGNSDQGERSGVTGGKNMDGFLVLIQDIVRRNGLAHAQICIERRLLTLPGFFRPTKLWDILVLNGGRLVAALELKSQVGPSFGNNFNNRTEEAIGTALDLKVAFREGALGQGAPQPFVGWLMLLEDCDRSREPVRDASPHFGTFPEFNGASYSQRYNILCQKLVQEQLYTAACFLSSPREAVYNGEYREMSESTGLRSFVSTLAGHIAAEASRGPSAAGFLF